MTSLQTYLEAIHALPLDRHVRVLNLSGDQERVIALSGLRRMMPDQVELVAGPGCAASICPGADVYQAIRLALDHGASVLVEESLLRMPIPNGLPGPRSLAEARDVGADVRTVSAPIEAAVLASDDPHREVVLFLTGFETLLAPLAGMLLEGLPENLSLLLCGRRIEPWLMRSRREATPVFDALLVPGNRCSLSGLGPWQAFAEDHGVPVAVAGYTALAIVSGLHAVLQQLVERRTAVSNCYRPLATPEGRPVLRDRMQRVFEVVNGAWRGIGMIQGSAFRLRPAFARHDANRRFPDYRALTAERADIPQGCHCAGVIEGRVQPAQCSGFNGGCRPDTPIGPCMASLEGTCHLHRVAVGSADPSVIVAR